MRRKNHLDERMQKAEDMLFVPVLKDRNMKTAAKEREYIDFAAYFKNANPTELEIGCGFGGFVCTLSKLHPEKNYIAVEKISNVVVSAAERAKAEGLKNIFFLNCAAEVLPRFIKEGSVEKIYLNFSTPLPKKGYAKQRLTHPRFLEIYKELLKEGGIIEQKTDDEDFYNFSLDSFKASDFKILLSCTDLTALNDQTNIVTEYENRFIQSGKKIFKIVAQI